MAFRKIDGQTEWSAIRDTEGHREYRIKHYVVTDDPRDGPAEAMWTPGLPAPGTEWSFDNDVDIWAICRPDMIITPMVTGGDKNTQFQIEQIFSTRPLNRCQDHRIEDPLLEPMKISGTFIKYLKEATLDRFLNPIVSSSHEQIRGPRVEFDESRPTIRIEQNVKDLRYDEAAKMRDRVNDATLWGFAKRCVKLSAFNWQDKYHGRCFKYYTRVFDFEVDPYTFDRDVPDEGTRLLNGHWDTNARWIVDYIGGQNPDKHNPSHFVRTKDREGNVVKFLLDGNGLPAHTTVFDDTVDTPGTVREFRTTDSALIHIEKYEEANFLLLGIPTTF